MSRPVTLPTQDLSLEQVFRDVGDLDLVGAGVDLEEVQEPSVGSKIPLFAGVLVRRIDPSPSNVGQL